MRPDELFGAALEAVKLLSPTSVSDSAGSRIHSTHQVGPFTDDLDVIIHSDGERSMLHVRSVSRIGWWDFWVNRIRVRRFLRLLNDALK